MIIIIIVRKREFTTKNLYLFTLNKKLHLVLSHH